MLMSEWSMNSAAGQLRGIASSMGAIVSEMTSAGVWSGPDADRLARDWNDQVTNRLHSAAFHMEAVQFRPMDQP